MVLLENAAGFDKGSVIFCAAEYKVCVIEVYFRPFSLYVSEIQKCQLYR